MKDYEQFKYCANDPCEAEAVMLVEETATPLCRTCAEAYMWGQASPDKHLAYIYDPACEEERQLK